MKPESLPIKSDSAPDVMLLGGRGAMAGQLRRFLPGRPRCVDILDLGSERRVRRALGGHLHHELPGRRAALEHVIFSLVPQEVYAHAAGLRGRRARLIHVLGIGGAGQSGTLLVPSASVLSTATSVLTGASGPVVGVHFMYGPAVTDLSRETAVLCAPFWASAHHLYPAARTYLHGLMTRMGHGRVLELTPQSHDALMADVQFLTHSLFLCLAAGMRTAQSGTGYRPDGLPGWMDDAMQIVQRILTQPAHVYAGIARDNPYNVPLAAAWLEQLAALGRMPLGHLATRLLGTARCLSTEWRSQAGVRASVTTPVSRYRDHLLALTPHWSAATGPVVDAGALARDYGGALAGRYADWFAGLAAWFPERQGNRSGALIAGLPTR